MENLSIIITFLAYLGFMLAVGTHFYKRNESLSDYLIGDRQLNKWVTSMSAQASDMSGWLLLGLPGYAYLQGMEAAWIALGLGVGTYLNWRFVARRLRRYTEIAGNAITLPDYFANRFHDHNRLLRTLSAVFILVFFLIYTASGFVAGAKLFESIFGLPYHSALLIGVVVIISYTALGGFMAVSWTDFFQGIIMFFAIITVPMLALHATGGFAESAHALREVDAGFLNVFTNGRGEPLKTIAVVSLMAWGMGYFGQPHILTRFMAIRSPDEIKPARRIAMIWVIVSLACAVLVGLAGRIFLPETLSDSDSEKVFMILVDQLTHPIVGGILLAAVLAAIMSTADSQLLVTSSALTEDLYRVIIRPSASDKELVWVSRGTVIGVAAVACAIALKPDSSVLDLVSYAWAGFGATFGPLVLISLYWKRMTRDGAIAGIIGGGITVLVWKQLKGGLFDLYEIVPGFAASVLLIVLVSLLGKKPTPEIEAQFKEARR
ncbi:High-affinity proline transporter PutP [Pontiella desulfatans]|uniref:Sodium/proline symporter n=1 Tax=Pontiella desulfatans TaxID=2750659 RepID=A0A6C2U6E6_PONDE|nr:sodium/proline symporter PutP [Pontiella desulfatans]VGO15590.1 High-affinity proline transporter PutP [Pontiella desulfatans]